MEWLNSCSKMKLKKLNRSQKGFTLLELLIAIPIIAIVVAAASGALVQVIQSTQTSAHMTAVRQVQTAGYWVSKDSLQAQNVITGASLTLNWKDWNDYNYQVVYSLQDMSGGLKWLQRMEEVNGTGVATTMVGQFIDPDNTSWVWDDTNRVLTFTVTAKVTGARGPQTETRTYEIQVRPDPSP